MTILEINTKYASLIEKTQNNPQLIFTLPYAIMIEFIHNIGKSGNFSLYYDLLEVAGDKFGPNIITFHLMKLL